MRVSRRLGEITRVAYKHVISTRIYECDFMYWERWADGARVRRRAEETDYSAELRLLGKDGHVYPGHPVTIAYMISKLYETFEEAFDRPKEKVYANALADNRVPGAGGCVHSAMYLLRILRDGQDWDAAMEDADETWAGTDSQAAGGSNWGRDETKAETKTRKQRYIERWKKGQEQADSLKPLLLELSHWWRPTT